MGIFVAVAVGCDPSTPPAMSAQPTTSLVTRAATATAVTTAPAPSASARPSATSSARPPQPVACRAPSRNADGPLDLREDAALERCGDPSVGARRRKTPCGGGPERPLPLERLSAAVPALDPETRTHVAKIVAEGKRRGRKARVFGVVGDSMSVSGAFLRALARPELTRLAPDLAPLITVGGETMLERYRGAEAVTIHGIPHDSFVAPRAARSGARAPWALRGGTQSPLRRMVRMLSPTVAFVLYGGNDAAYYTTDGADLIGRFKSDLGRVIDALEEEGVVPVLHTLARHGNAPGVDDCGAPTSSNDWKLMVRTNALSIAVIEMACERALPLIDLRDALDTADAAGLGGDATHPSVHADGSGRLDAAGLKCGHNLRNFLTLGMLARLQPLL